MFFRLACISLAFLLSACVTVSPTSIPRSLANAPAADMGTVFGTIGATGYTDISNMTVRFRRLGSEDGGSFDHIRPSLFAQTARDFEDSSGYGTVFSARLPAGEYEVFNVWFYRSTQFGTTDYSLKDPVSIRFTVQPGRATYLGEFIGHRMVGQNMFGTPVTAGAYFVVSDKLARDVELLKKKGNAPDPAGIDNQVQAFANSGTPAFRDRPWK